MRANLTDEQRAKILFNSPEFDWNCCPVMQKVKHICLEWRKEQEQRGEQKNVFNILPYYFDEICAGKSPITCALHMENFTQAIALVNEGADDFNCAVHPEPTLSTSTPSLHLASLFSIMLRNLASNSYLMDSELKQDCTGMLNDLLYMYRKLKKGTGINLILLAAYHATHSKENIPAVFDVMEKCASKPEAERWQNLDQYMTKIEAPELIQKYTDNGRIIWVKECGGR